MPRTYVLRVFLNARQLDVIERVERAIHALLPDRRVGRVGPRAGAITVTCYFRGWPSLFPQHGPGRKHARHIVLEAWQREIVEAHAIEFLRGLIDSDGCRHRRIVNGRNYPAYSFENRSRDILGLFASSCDRLGVHHIRSSATVISINRRADVRRLDRLFEWVTDADHRLDIPTVLEATTPYLANSGSGLPTRKCPMRAARSGPPRAHGGIVPSARGAGSNPVPLPRSSQRAGPPTFVEQSRLTGDFG